jgi:hypothetical protein
MEAAGVIAKHGPKASEYEETSQVGCAHYKTGLFENCAEASAQQCKRANDDQHRAEFQGISFDAYDNPVDLNAKYTACDKAFEYVSQVWHPMQQCCEYQADQK